MSFWTRVALWAIYHLNDGSSSLFCRSNNIHVTKFSSLRRNILYTMFKTRTKLTSYMWDSALHSHVKNTDTSTYKVMFGPIKLDEPQHFDWRSAGFTIVLRCASAQGPVCQVAHLPAKIFQKWCLLMWCNFKLEGVLFRSDSRQNDRVDCMCMATGSTSFRAQVRGLIT